MRLSTLFFALAAVLGGLFAFANLPGEQGKATRDLIVAALAPVGGLTDEARNAFFYSIDAKGTPSSAFDALVSKDRVDYAFVSCVKYSGADMNTALMKFLSMSDHQTVANVVSCYVDANRPARCTPAGRAGLDAMMEIYLWARQHSLKQKAGGYSLPAIGADGRPVASDPADEAWDGADDRAIFSNLKRLAADGYISLDDFGWFPRSEIRQALAGVVATRTPCATQSAAAQ